jgi:hypothetical protein
MKKHIQRLFGVFVLLAFVMFAGAADAKAKKSKHINGHALSKEHLKKDGTHALPKNGKHTPSVDTKGGKVAGFHVKHDTKGDVAVRKVKSKDKKVALLDGIDGPIAVDTAYLYDGYCYVDDDDVENCYWYPVEVVVDDFTGAVEYIEPV